MILPQLDDDTEQKTEYISRQLLLVRVTRLAEEVISLHQLLDQLARFDERPVGCQEHFLLSNVSYRKKTHKTVKTSVVRF